MKLTTYIIIPVLVLCLSSMAVGEKLRSTIEQDRVPKINIVRAVQFIIDHHRKSNPETGEVFVDEALFVRTKDESFWKVGVRLKTHETGHLYYKVTTEGKVTLHSAVKDG